MGARAAYDKWLREKAMLETMTRDELRSRKERERERSRQAREEAPLTGLSA